MAQPKRCLAGSVLIGQKRLSAAFKVREFRFVWLAELLSLGGDQASRVAVAIVVYGRTRSATWAGFSYALTFLPAVVGGVLLSWPADRYRRREVMIAADLARAVLVTVMAVPRLPLWALCCLLVSVVLAGAPFTAAQGALLPDVLPGELYPSGLAVRQVTSQSVQLIGFGAGGLLAAASPAYALLGNAATFLASAALVRIGVADRLPPDRPVIPAPGQDGTGAGRGGTAAAIAAVVGDPRRRTLMLLAWLVGWYVVPEALAAPYADQLGTGTATVGLLMAADPLGSVVGVWLFVRLVPDDVRDRLIGALAVAAGIPLVLCVFRPGLLLTVALWALSGMASTAYLLQAQASFVRATPETDRGSAIGVAASGIIAAQGGTVLVGGLLADRWDPATAVATAGTIGAVLALGGAVAWRRANRSRTQEVLPAR